MEGTKVEGRKPPGGCHHGASREDADANQEGSTAGKGSDGHSVSQGRDELHSGRGAGTGLTGNPEGTQAGVRMDLESRLVWALTFSLSGGKLTRSLKGRVGAGARYALGGLALSPFQLHL